LRVRIQVRVGTTRRVRTRCHLELGPKWVMKKKLFLRIFSQA
jgi:hypothetical protein